MVRSWTEIENNIVSVERVREYLTTPKEVANKLLTLLAEVNILQTKLITFPFHLDNPPSFTHLKGQLCFL